MAFWFNDTAGVPARALRKEWFAKDSAFDQAIRSQFLELHLAGARGELNSWLGEASAALALIIVLDQFPRNMFRDTPHAFATDPLALHAAQSVVEHNLDQRLSPLQRLFVYLPFEHAEDLAAQRRSLELFGALRAYPECGTLYDYAERHHKVIERFGRFPHRNRILSRMSSAEEIEFLRQPGSSF